MKILSIIFPQKTRFPTQFYQSQLISPYPSSSITRTKNGSIPKTSKSSTAWFMHNTIAFFLIDSVRTYAWLNANLAGKLLRKRSVTNSTTFQNSIRLFIKESVQHDTPVYYFPVSIIRCDETITISTQNMP